MSDNPYESPSADGKLSIEKTPARGAGLIRWLVVGAILMVLVSLLLPARRTATVAARRNTCTNHLKQIAFALLNYQEVYGSLPPAHTVDAAGKPLHSWRVLILPFMEEAALYDKIDLAKPWDDPANREAFETTISGYECPSTDGPPAHTTYLAVATTGGCFQPGQPRKLDEIADGTSQTLMVVDVDSAHSVHWMSPQDAGDVWFEQFGASLDTQHPGGILAAFVDGHVSWITETADQETLRALTTVAGRDSEVLDPED